MATPVIKAGTVSVTSGETLVVGSGVDWSNVRHGAAFTVFNSHAPWIVSNNATNFGGGHWELTLATPFNGITASGVVYQISTDFIQVRARLLTPTPIFEGWILDLSEQGKLDGNIYFHNQAIQGSQNILWQGNTYQPFPVVGKGFEKNANAQLPRPTFGVSDIGGIITSLCNLYDDCVDGIVTRKSTFMEFMDKLGDGTTNNPNYDPIQGFQDEVWRIERKSAQVAGHSVSFALSALIDAEGIVIPGRTANAYLCSHTYRSGDGCGYAGAPVADEQDNVFSGTLVDRGVWSAATSNYVANNYVYVLLKGIKQYYVVKSSVVGSVLAGTLLTNTNYWTPERCGKRIHSCELRFGVGNELDSSVCPGLSDLATG